MTVKIDLESTIEPTFVSEDLTHYIFPTNTSEGNATDLHVIISKHPDPLLPNVYNLAFGPMDENGQLDDKAKVHHPDLSDTNRSRKPANHTDLRVFCFISYQETPINIKEDVSNCVSDFSYLNSLTQFDINN